jgi:hypothetical protein
MRRGTELSPCRAVWALLPLALPLVLLAACDPPRAHGDVHAIIVAADAELWTETEDEVVASIAPTIQVVRNEPSFRVAWEDPADGSSWGQLQRFRNMVVVGARGDAWVDEALDAMPSDAAEPSVGDLVRIDNVWARGQSVTLVLLPSTRDADAFRAALPALNELLDEEYRLFTRNRMFVSGANDSLADSLATHVGFRLEFPSVYRYSVRDSIFRFRNDNPDPSELIREIGVTWVSPIPDSLPSPGAIAAWRQAFSEAYYNDAQVVDTALTSVRTVSAGDAGSPGIEFQAAWSSPSDAWPAGGPTITRVLPCPAQDRLYYLDAWLYAPSRAKYEYMIQLQTILDSFRCGS